MEAFRYNPFKVVTGADRPIYDTVAALVCHGVFARFPNVRFATIESGSEWVGELVTKLQKSFKQIPALSRVRIRSSSCAVTCGCRRTTRTTSRVARRDRRRSHHHRIRLPARRGSRRSDLASCRTSPASPTTRSG